MSSLKNEDIFNKEVSSESSDIPDDEYEVKEIKDDRWDAKQKRRIYLVSWLGYPGQDTWEPASNLNCPEKLEIYKEMKKKRIREASDDGFLVDNGSDRSSSRAGSSQNRKIGIATKPATKKKRMVAAKRHKFENKWKEEEESEEENTESEQGRPSLTNNEAGSKRKKENKMALALKKLRQERRIKEERTVKDEKAGSSSRYTHTRIRSPSTHSDDSSNIKKVIMSSSDSPSPAGTNEEPPIQQEDSANKVKGVEMCVEKKAGADVAEELHEPQQKLIPEPQHGFAPESRHVLTPPSLVDEEEMGRNNEEGQEQATKENIEVDDINICNQHQEKRIEEDTNQEHCEDDSRNYQQPEEENIINQQSEEEDGPDQVKESATTPPPSNVPKTKKLPDYCTGENWWKHLDKVLLDDNKLAKIPLEPEDSPNYEPIQPFDKDGPLEGFIVRVFKDDERNGFDRGWKVESILGIAPKNMCFVKFIGFQTPQKIPFHLVERYAANEYKKYRDWVACKRNVDKRGAYWDEELNKPSTWMTPRAMKALDAWMKQK